MYFLTQDGDSLISTDRTQRMIYIIPYASQKATVEMHQVVIFKFEGHPILISSLDKCRQHLMKIANELNRPHRGARPEIVL